MQKDHEDMGAIRSQGPRSVLDKNRAPRGVIGHNVRYVLFVGLAGVVIAFLLFDVFMNKIP